MSSTSPDPVTLSRKALKVVIALNLVMGGLILGLLIASLIASSAVFKALGVAADHDNAALITGMRVIMVIGIASVPVVHLILSRLVEIFRTVTTGDPFVTENATRLRTIAWALLGLEVLHLAVGAISAGVSTAAQPLDLDWNLSLTRWLAVLPIFVLARVFDHGTRMRQDLEGTV
ncbi:MAG: DUF2975 domain-containing protein [Chloroflexi bacterium]|nr:DUF2975 domain-containing protein [Chloroflexota bacterium]